MDETTGNGTGSARDMHLRALRDLLSRDYLASADWGYALADLARSVRQVLGAQEAMVALWRPQDSSWEAIASDGRYLRDEAIAERGSRSVLESVRLRDAPCLVTEDDEIGLDSESIQAQHIEGFLVVPLHFWDVKSDRRARSFGGCLYAHRTFERLPFTPTDVEIMVDIVRIAEPTLNVLRHLREVEVHLQASREELSLFRKSRAARVRFGPGGVSIPSRVHDTLARIVENSKVTLLILGPTGSGKSHLARAYHDACPRRDKPFIVLDCGSVTSAETLGAELFGYEPSSGYANAPRAGRHGKARLAHEGTLFIDEVANLAPELQARLLRLIQDGTYGPLGGSVEEQVDIQIVAATNADLRRRVTEGSFREDLFHRLNVVSVALPGLNERSDEIPDLTREVLARVCADAGRELMAVSDDAIGELVAHDWSEDGNIRGLENLLRRSVWASPRGTAVLDAGHLRWFQEPGTGMVAEAGSGGRRRSRRDAELERIKEAIRGHQSATRAAEILGITYRQLYWKLQRAGLSVRDVLSGS